jgi:hypothetical protein
VALAAAIGVVALGTAWDCHVSNSNRYCALAAAVSARTSWEQVTYHNNYYNKY